VLFGGCRDVASFYVREGAVGAELNSAAVAEEAMRSFLPVLAGLAVEHAFLVVSGRGLVHELSVGERNRAVVSQGL
jgi:hypothetical protein